MPKFKEYLEESDKYYVHMTYLKGTDRTDIKLIEEKLTDTFMQLQFEQAPRRTNIVNSYKTPLTKDKFYYTLVFDVTHSGAIVKTPRKRDTIVQTSDSPKEMS
jgi:hypothetical protein